MIETVVTLVHWHVVLLRRARPCRLRWSRWGHRSAATALPGRLLIVECVPEDETSAAVGMQAVVRTAFQGVASSFAGIFLARDQVHLGSAAFLSETGLRTTAYVAMAACVVGFAISLRRRPLPLLDPARAGFGDRFAGADRRRPYDDRVS